MNEDKDKRAYVFLVIQSLLCFLLAVMLIAAVMDIYRTGVAVQAENPRWLRSSRGRSLRNTPASSYRCFLP